MLRTPDALVKPAREETRLLVGMEPSLPVAIGQNKFLHALSRVHFAGVEVALGIHGDGIDPVEITGHAPVVPDGSGHFSGFSVLDPYLIVGSVGDQRVLALRVVGECKIVDRAAHSVNG